MTFLLFCYFFAIALLLYCTFAFHEVRTVSAGATAPLTDPDRTQRCVGDWQRSKSKRILRPESLEVELQSHGAVQTWAASGCGVRQMRVNRFLRSLV